MKLTKRQIKKIEKLTELTFEGYYKDRAEFVGTTRYCLVCMAINKNDIVFYDPDEKQELPILIKIPIKWLKHLGEILESKND